MFLVRVAIDQAFAGGADVNVVLGHVAKVLLAKASLGLRPRGHRFGQGDCDTRLFARQNLRAVEVAAVSDHIEALRLQRRLCLLGHVGELGSIRADIGHFMGDDQMVLGVDRCLHIVADHSRASPARRHRARVGVRQ